MRIELRLVIIFLVSSLNWTHSTTPVLLGKSEKVYKDGHKPNKVYYEDWNYKLRESYRFQVQPYDIASESVDEVNATEITQSEATAMPVPESFVLIKKCCLLNETLSVTLGNPRCEETSANGNSAMWQPTLYSEPEVKLDEYRNVSFLTIGLPNCEWTILDNKLDIWFNILEDGTASVGLNFWTIPLWLKPLDRSGYCLDTLESSNSSKSDKENERNYVLVFCELENFQLYMALRMGSGVVFMISALSLLTTIIVYILLWNTHSIHGWTQFSFFVSYFLYFIFEGSRIFAKLNGLRILPSKMCFMHAIAAHFFTVVITGTSCVMNFDCFMTFWKLRSVRSKMKRDMLIYICLSWGIPLVTLIVGLYLHFVNNPETGEKEVSGVFEYAHYRCSSPVWEFAFRVQLLMLLVNFLAFIGTICLIVKHFRSTKMAHVNRPGSDSRTKFKKSLKLFVKLFFITGIGWVLTAVDLILGYKNPTGWIFVLIRFFLSLQGVAYMLIFGLHRKNFAQLRRKYPIVSELLSSSRMFRSTTGSSTHRQRSNTSGSRSQQASTKQKNLTQVNILQKEMQ